MKKMIRICDYCKKLGATYKTPEYGSVFNWCSKQCYEKYTITELTKG